MEIHEKRLHDHSVLNLLLAEKIKREQVVEFLKHTVWQKPQLMIYTLIQKIVLYDDRIEIFYNYIDPIKPDGSSADDDHRLFFIWDNSNILQPVSPTQKQHLQSGAVFVLALFQSVEPIGSREAFTPKPNRGDPFRGVG